RYLTFRSMVAFVLTVTLVLVLQPRFISWFKKRNLGQPIRDDGPQSHITTKQGTPTMGGIVVVFAVSVSTFLLSDLKNVYVWAIIAITLLYGALGFVDDFSKVR